MTPIGEMSTVQLFEQLVLNTRALATVTQEMYGDAPFPDPRTVAEYLETMNPAEYFSMMRHNHQEVTRMHQMTPVLLSIMHDMVEVETTMLARIEEGA